MNAFVLSARVCLLNHIMRKHFVVTNAKLNTIMINKLVNEMGISVSIIWNTQRDMNE